MSILLSGRIQSNGISIGTPAPAFNPVTFWAGEKGGFWNFADPSTLFSNAAATTPASVDGPVRAVTDISGLGNTIKDTSGTHLFTMKSGYCITASAGGLSTVPLTAIGGNGYTALALFRPNTFAGIQTIIDSDWGPTTRVAQNLGFRTGTNKITPLWFEGNSTFQSFTSTTNMTDATDTFCSVMIQNSGASIRVVGATVTGGTAYTIPTKNAAISIGASSGSAASASSQLFLGRMYCAAWINRTLSDAEIIEIGDYMNSLAGTAATI